MHATTPTHVHWSQHSRLHQEPEQLALSVLWISTIRLCKVRSLGDSQSVINPRLCPGNATPPGLVDGRGAVVEWCGPGSNLRDGIRRSESRQASSIVVKGLVTILNALATAVGVIREPNNRAEKFLAIRHEVRW